GHLVAELGFGPRVGDCANCHQSVPLDRLGAFSHPAGGTLCDACARTAGLRRVLPSDARIALDRWLRGADAVAALNEGGARAHQRLLREFLREHLTDGRPLRAFDAWERELSSPPIVEAQPLGPTRRTL